MVDFGLNVTSRSTTNFPSGVEIAPDDANVRFLGGNALRGKAFPYSRGLLGQAVTAGDPTTLAGNTGLPATRYGLNVGYEFTLPTGATSVEIANLWSGTNSPTQIAIDGKFANEAGYDSGFSLVNPGNTIYTELTFPALTKPTRFTVYVGNSRTFMGIRLPTGGSLSPATAGVTRTSVVFQGDSITEGTGATQQVFSWVMQSAFRLGIDNPINVGIGGSGYLRRRAWAGTAGYNFRERLDDVTKAVGGSPPDAVVVAGGLNDCGVSNGPSFTADETGAEALLYFQALRAAAPNMLIFVVGPFSDWNNPTYHPTTAACRDAIFSAASKVSGTHTIDVSNWITAENRNTMFDSTKDKVHPLPAGHAIYGERFSQAYLSIINALP